MFFHNEKVTVREKEDVYQVYLTKERFALLRIYDVKDDVIYLKDKKQAVCLRLSFLEENGVNEDTTEENERKLIEALDQIGGVMKIYFLKEAKNTLQQNIEYWRQLAKAAKDPNYKEAIYERLYYLDYYCRLRQISTFVFVEAGRLEEVMKYLSMVFSCEILKGKELLSVLSMIANEME